MKDHYDFSVAERGKFYRADATFRFPIHLEPDINDFLLNLAKQRNLDLNALVNELLRADIKIIQSSTGDK